MSCYDCGVSPVGIDTNVAAERCVDKKHEVWGDEVCATADTSFAHGQIVANLGTDFRDRRRATTCAVLSSLRLVIPEKHWRLRGYHVVCGGPGFRDDEQAAVVNPTLVVAVLSAST